MKYTKAQVRKRINRLVDLSMKVNCKTEKCVFVYVSGHIDGIEINICRSKSKYNDYEYRMASYYQGQLFHADEFIKKTDEAEKKLLNCLK